MYDEDGNEMEGAVCHFGRDFEDMKDKLEPLDMSWTEDKRVVDRSLVVQNSVGEDVSTNFVVRKRRKVSVSQ